MLYATVIALVLSSQLAPKAPLPQAEPVPRHWDRVSWSKRPLPELPQGARGTMQAQITCVAGEQNRVVSCRLDRQLPVGGRFGRNVLRSMRDARTHGNQMRPGDTMTFAVWACVELEEGEPCLQLPWPEVQ